MQKTRKGFTLVELVVVIAVIAILAGVLIGTFASVINKANESAKVQVLKQQEIEQKATDILNKLENSNWLGWEDFEANVVEALTSVVEENSTTLTEDQVKQVVEDALASFKASQDATSLTKDQVEAIIENAIGKIEFSGVTEAQVRTIVAASSSNILSTQLTAAQVKSIINAAEANDLTAADVVLAMKKAGITEVTDLQTAVDSIVNALNTATSSLATSDDVKEIKDYLAAADASNVVTAKALNIKLSQNGLSTVSYPYEVVSVVGETLLTTTDSTSTILLYIDPESKAPTFVVKSGENYEYNGGLATSGIKDVDLWKFDTVVDDKYSTYLLSSYTSTEPIANLTTGLDVGENDEVTDISYVRTTGDQQTVVIRTYGGTLTVNAQLDTVMHYGEAQVVTLTAVGTSSYYENGSVQQVNIKKGRLVLTNNENSSVETVYLQATGETYDNIILATQNGAELPNLITRDNVPLPTGNDTKKVVTIQTNVNNEGKQPEKTETINLYATQGTSGNDVYEATNGYNVSDLALLVVEASSTEAKAQAAEQISNSEILEKVNEVKSVVEVSNEADFESALRSSAKYIVLTSDFTVNQNKHLIDYSVIIDGAKHTISTTANNYEFLHVKESNITVSISNLNYTSTQGKSFVRVGEDNAAYSKVKLNINECTITEKYYALNLRKNLKCELNVSGSTITGWAALNSWAYDSIININNSTMIGRSISNEGFGTLVFDGGAYFVEGGTTYGLTVHVNHSTLKQITTDFASAEQNAISIQFGAKLCDVYLDNTEIVNEGEGFEGLCYEFTNDNGSKVYVDGALVYQGVDPQIWYSNGAFASDKSTSGSQNTTLKKPFDEYWMANGEGIILLTDVTMDSNATCTMKNGFFYFYFDGHNVTGGKIIIKNGVSVISDTSGKASMFECATNGYTIVETNNGDGTYTYSCSASN